MAQGAHEVLSWLQGHGIKLAVLSNTLWPAEAHRLDLRRCGLLHYFDLILFSTETGLWKPDPRFFGLALEDVDPSAYSPDARITSLKGTAAGAAGVVERIA